MSEISGFKKKIKDLDPIALREAKAVCEEKIQRIKNLKRNTADLSHSADREVVKQYNKFLKDSNRTQREWESLLKEINNRL